MIKKQETPEKQIDKYEQGSGSKYHEEHASNVPDYGQYRGPKCLRFRPFIRRMNPSNF